MGESSFFTETNELKISSSMLPTITQRVTV